MKRVIAIGLAAVMLGGCAQLKAFEQKVSGAYTFVTTATVPATEAQIAVSSFEVLEAGATAYFKYCAKFPAENQCAAGTVDVPGPLRTAIKYDRQGRAARDQIKAAGKTGALISATAYNLLQQATNNLSATPAANFGATK